MRGLRTIIIGALGAAAIMTVAATGPSAAATASHPSGVAHAAAMAHRQTTVTGFLVDGNSPPGEGSAASPRPLETPYDGEPTQQVNSGAWRIQFTGLAWSQIPLANPSADNLCYTDVSRTVKLRPCSRNTAYQYWEETGTGPGFNLKNQGSGKFLCAAGGVGSGDKTTTLDNCTEYHHTWVIQDNP